jgi:hypothetical protein
MRSALTFALLLAISFGAAAGAVAEVAGDGSGSTHCSCPIKGPCCKGPVCRMELARREAAGVTLHSCGETPSEATLPPLPRWIGVLPQVAPFEAANAPWHELVACETLPVTGFTTIPDRPPRPLPATA